MANITARTWVDGETVDAQKMNTISSDLDALNNGKLEKPASEGAADQVLHTDGAGGTYWGEGGGSGGGTWGTITGNISSQTDLAEVVSPLINQWDEQWEVGTYSADTGAKSNEGGRIRSSNFIPVKANTSYYAKVPTTYTAFRVACYDSNKAYLGRSTGWLAPNQNSAFTTPSNTAYITFNVTIASATYNHDISINYPSTYTGYYPSALPKEKAHIGGLGNAIGMKGWNQLITGKIETNNWGGVTVTETNGRITGSGTVATTFEALMQNYIPVKEGHKYYLKTPKVYTNLRWELYPLSFTEQTGARSEHEIILTANTARQIAIYARGNSGDFISVDGYFQFIDLTALFGAGNEPSSVEDFRAMFPADYYPYCSGAWADLLWENASPTSAFASQTISIDLSPYKFVAFRVRTVTSQSNSVLCLAANDSDGSVLAIAANNAGSACTRPLTASSSGVWFGNGSSVSGNTLSQDNTRAVPVAIYGIR